jgi:hypothetical protein
LQGGTALCRDALCERGVPPRAPCNGSLPLDRLRERRLLLRLCEARSPAFRLCAQLPEQLCLPCLRGTGLLEAQLAELTPDAFDALRSRLSSGESGEIASLRRAEAPNQLLSTLDDPGELGDGILLWSSTGALKARSEPSDPSPSSGDLPCLFVDLSAAPSDTPFESSLPAFLCASSHAVTSLESLRP